MTIGCLLIHLAPPFPNVPEVAAKLAWLKSHRADYDTIFLGSSRVRRQISPGVFDRQMKTRGVETRSYNFGIDAMTFPELPYVLDRLLEAKPSRLKLVVIDLNPLRRKLDPTAAEPSLREIYWHDFSRTAQVCESILRDSERVDVDASERLGLLWAHFSMMLRHYGNLGRGNALLKFDRTGRSDEAPPVGMDGTGYFPVAEVLKPAEAASYAQKLAEIGALGARPTPRDPVLERELQRVIEKIEHAGARAFFFIAPTVSSTRPFAPSPTTSTQPVTIAFDDPVQFPGLYDPRHRYDLQHLNAVGADEFSTLLADRMAGHLGASPQGHE